MAKIDRAAKVQLLADFDAQYAAFGMVTEGLDVVDKIADVKTGRYGYFSDVPRTPVVIESIRRAG